MDKHHDPRGWRAWLAGLFAGAIGGIVMTVVMLLLRAFFGVATPLELIGDRVSALIPVDPFLALMGRVGGYDQMKQLGVSSVILGQILAGAFGGWMHAVIVRRTSRASARRVLFALLVLLPLVVFAIALWPVLGTHYRGLPVDVATGVTLVGLLLSFLAYERSVAAGYRFLTNPVREPEPVEYSPPMGRRAVLLGGLGILVGAGAVGLLRRLYMEATFSYDGTQYKGEGVEPITPNEKFYVVTKNVIDPVVNPALWRLELTGLVSHRRSYTLDDLRALPSVNQETTLMCISNQIGAGLMSNAVWKGVPMRTFLEAAGAAPTAREVILHGVDNYTDTFAFEKAMNPTTLVAYEMNGAPLPQRHGAPARVIVPGLFGEKHVKWLTRIEVVDHDAKGFYEKQGWGPDFVIPTRSRIDVPEPDAQLHPAAAAGSIPVKGVAFAGDRGVARVEISLDDEQTWQDAKLDYPGTELSWALWSFDWRPEHPGEYRIIVRATDRLGNVQAFDENRPRHSGITGLHRIGVKVA